MAGGAFDAAAPPGSDVTGPEAAGPWHAPVRTRWRLSDRTFDLDRPRIAGVLNLTPDSFSDGGELPSVDAALARARSMVAAGADLLDVGGESTRPGAGEVPADEELDRILPFLRAAVERFGVPISVDTRKARVAEAALDAGAQIVNDVSGLEHDEAMAPLLAARGAGVVLMHMRGTPATMRSRTGYGDVVADVRSELAARVRRARDAGIEEERIVLDPGIGFAKDADQSLRLLRETHRLLEAGFPLMVGPSRKSFLGAVLGTPPRDRLEGTLAACAAAYVGGARLFRVHDVREVARALRVLEAIERGRAAGGPEGTR